MPNIVSSSGLRILSINVTSFKKGKSKIISHLGSVSSYIMKTGVVSL